MSYQTPLGKIKRIFIATLLLQSALIFTAIQAVSAEENTMTIAIGDWAGIGTDPTLHETTFPDIGGVQDHHQFTHLEPLITLDIKGNIIPWLAESYEVSDDNKAITFHLRKGIKFADGKPLNASVLGFYFDRLITYGMSSRYGEKGAKFPIYIYYDRSEAIDEYTLRICFTHGWLQMPKDLASNRRFGYFIHPDDLDPAWDIKGTLKKEKRFNGLGPYYVDENVSVSNQKVVLKRRLSWRDDHTFHKPGLDQIILKLIKDPQVAVTALEKGEVDYICRYWNAPLDLLPSLETNPIVSIKTAPDSQMYYLQAAYWKEPFSGEDGILLRKAICYALNRTEMVASAFKGYAYPATDSMLLSPLRPDSPECCHKGYDYDLDKAKGMLADAGWNDSDGDGILDKDGKSLKDIDLVITSASELSWQNDIAQVVQSQLKKIGIDVQIRAVEISVYSETSKTGEFDLRLTYSMGQSGSAIYELKPFNMKLGTINRYNNPNETLATIIGSAEMANCAETQEEYLCQACNILYEEAGIIPLVYGIQYAVMNNRVNGFQFGASACVYEQDHVEECWIE